jgi:hypothetical protein
MNENITKACCTLLNYKMALYGINMIYERGNKLDQDKNSSINIMLSFLLTGLWTAYQLFVDNLRQLFLSINGALEGNLIRSVG